MEEAWRALDEEEYNDADTGESWEKKVREEVAEGAMMDIIQAEEYEEEQQDETAYHGASQRVAEEVEGQEQHKEDWDKLEQRRKTARVARLSRAQNLIYLSLIHI